MPVKMHVTFIESKQINKYWSYIEQLISLQTSANGFLISFA